MSSFPLTPIERQVKTHALLSSTGFLILLPLGVLLARYLRTYVGSWWTAHWIVQLLVSGPVIFTGWAFGYKSTQQLFTGGNFNDPHKKIGLTLLILYLFQILLGFLIHFYKISTLGRGRRPIQNYVHVGLGLLMLALAAYQSHYGFTIEWYTSIGFHSVTPAAMKAWLALVIVFWVPYFVGLVFLLRQLRQERNSKSA